MESVKKSIDERAQHKREYDTDSSELSRPIYDDEPIGEGTIQLLGNQYLCMDYRHLSNLDSIMKSFKATVFASKLMSTIDLSVKTTTHYLPKERESAVTKPHHMIAPGSSRYNSNDMVHNHYLEEAKKKTQESSRNSEPSVMPYARSQSTTNGSKPKPRINNQKSKNWPASSSCIE
ncbi:hypothetical protein Tco_0936072 [Tanacetum coccineum]